MDRACSNLPCRPRRAAEAHLALIRRAPQTGGYNTCCLVSSKPKSINHKLPTEPSVTHSVWTYPECARRTCAYFLNEQGTPARHSTLPPCADHRFHTQSCSRSLPRKLLSRQALGNSRPPLPPSRQLCSTKNAMNPQYPKRRRCFSLSGGCPVTYSLACSRRAQSIVPS